MNKLILKGVMMKNLLQILLFFLLISITAFPQDRTYDEFMLENAAIKNLYENLKLNTGVLQGFNEEDSRIAVNKTQLGSGFQLSEEIHQNWDSPNWVSYKKRTYTYDVNNNNLIEELEIWLDGSGSKGKWTYIYDINNNNLVEKLSERWDTTHWTNVFKTTYLYDLNNNNLIEELMQIWSVSNNWWNNSKIIYTYDVNNNRVQILVQNWNGSDWVNSVKYIYIFDVNNNNIESVIQIWDGSDWVNHRKLTNIFDQYNNIVESWWQSWDGSNWVNWFKYLYTYDVNNNLIVTLWQRWNGSNYVNYYKETNTYDVNNNNLIKSLGQNWENSNWVNTNRATYYYLPAGSEQIEHKRSNLNKAIEDFQTTEDDLIISSLEKTDQTLSLIGVQVLIDSVLHTSDSDLEFTLSHNGISETIIYQAGGSGDNFIGTKLTDDGIDSISSGIAPFSGNYKPENPLSPFAGTDPIGTWTLSIYDGAAGNNGMLESWGLILIYNSSVGVEDENSFIPEKYILNQNYPNPFNPSTVISWQAPVGSWQTLKIYDVLGSEVTTLVDEYRPAGEYEVEFNSHSDEGQNLSSGVYFYQLRIKGSEINSGQGIIQTKKMILIK
jgi:hypothetical protein